MDIPCLLPVHSRVSRLGFSFRAFPASRLSIHAFPALRFYRSHALTLYLIIHIPPPRALASSRSLTCTVFRIPRPRLSVPLAPALHLFPVSCLSTHALPVSRFAVQVSPPYILPFTRSPSSHAVCTFSAFDSHSLPINFCPFMVPFFARFCRRNDSSRKFRRKTGRADGAPCSGSVSACLCAQDARKREKRK